MNKTSILVLGATGLLGKSIEKRLEKLGFSVLQPSSKALNILDSTDLLEYIKHHLPNIVINCAAWTNVDLAESHSREVFEVNAWAPAQLAKILNSFGIRLIQFSSAYVFSGENSDAWKEDSKTSPVNIYGESKALSEELTLGNNPENTLIIRTWGLYGKGKGFVKNIIEKIESGSTRVEVVADQIGQPTYVDDISKIFVQLALSNLTGIIHCTNSGVASKYELARAICSLKDLSPEIIIPIETKFNSQQANRPKNSVLSLSKLQSINIGEVLDWRISLQNYLLDIYEN